MQVKVVERAVLFVLVLLLLLLLLGRRGGAVMLHGGGRGQWKVMVGMIAEVRMQVVRRRRLRGAAQAAGGGGRGRERMVVGLLLLRGRRVLLVGRGRQRLLRQVRRLQRRTGFLRRHLLVQLVLLVH